MKPSIRSCVKNLMGVCGAANRMLDTHSIHVMCTTTINMCEFINFLEIAWTKWFGQQIPGMNNRAGRVYLAHYCSRLYANIGLYNFPFIIDPFNMHCAMVRGLTESMPASQWLLFILLCACEHYMFKIYWLALTCLLLSACTAMTHSYIPVAMVMGDVMLLGWRPLDGLLRCPVFGHLCDQDA